jgi:hypothetical protein
MHARLGAPLLLAACGLLARPVPGWAHRIASRFEAARVPAPDSARRYAPTYWVEGATIGAAVLATTGAFLAAAWCDLDESGESCGPAAYLGGVTLGGVVGAGAGALVGGLFDAPRPRPLRGHAVRAALIGAVSGAAWSVGFLCHGLAHGCGREEARFGISSSAVGALAGWLVAH